MTKRPGVYLIRCEPTGRLYVGSSQHVPRRLYVHRWLLRRGKHFSIQLQRAWGKYGEAAFTFEEHEIVSDPGQRIAREQYWIDYFQTANGHGFNTCSVAGTRAGVPQPPSVAEKIRSVHLGKPKSPEQRAKMSTAAKGREKSPEHRAKLAAATRKQMLDPSRRAKAIEYGRMAKGRCGRPKK